MKINISILSKIKIVGALLTTVIFTVIGVTIHINNKTSKDATIINMAGKQRMLTQKMAKNIFYIHTNNKYDFRELDAAYELFSKHLYMLSNGDYKKGLYVVDDELINNQLIKVKKMWQEFSQHIISFKHNKLTKQDNNKLVQVIYDTNGELLYEIDRLVGMYTKYSEAQISYIISFQYYAGLFLLIILVYILVALKKIESQVNNFLEYTKSLASTTDISDVVIKEIDDDLEFKEASSSLSCFITKVNSAVQESNIALEHSQKASYKLEQINDEFDEVLKGIENSAMLADDIDKSEDMMIESSEELLQSTQKLQKLKDQLDKLLKSCQ